MRQHNATAAPAWWDVREPDERVYWYAGIRPTEAAATSQDGSLVVWESEVAARVGRELFLASGHYCAYCPEPLLVTRQLALRDAKLLGCHSVFVRDGMLNLVEEWTV